jgi:hypothetical protein
LNDASPLAIGITSFVLTKLEVLVSLQFLSWHPGMDRRDEGSIGREVKLLIPVDMGGSAAIGSKGLIHGL